MPQKPKAYKSILNKICDYCSKKSTQEDVIKLLFLLTNGEKFDFDPEPVWQMLTSISSFQLVNSFASLNGTIGAQIGRDKVPTICYVFDLENDMFSTLKILTKIEKFVKN